MGMKGKGGDKMSNAEVMQWLADNMTSEEYTRLRDCSEIYLPWDGSRNIVAHAMVDAYSDVSDATKTAFRQITRKFMNDSVVYPDEQSEYDKMVKSFREYFEENGEL